MSVTPLHMLCIFASILLLCVVYTRMLDLFLTPRREPDWIKWLLVVGLAVILFFSSRIASAQIRMPVNIAIYSAYLCALYKGRIGQKLLLIAAHLTMLILSEIVAASALAPFIDAAMGYAGESVMGTIAAGTFVVYCFAYLLIKRCRGAMEDQLSKKVWLGIAFCATTVFLTVWYMFCMTPAVRDVFQTSGSGFAAFLGGDIINWLLTLMLLMVIVQLFWILREMNRSLRRTEEEDLRRRRALYQKREGQLQSVYDETVRSMQGDMAERLKRLEAYRQAGDFAGQHQYIEAMLAGPLRAPTLPRCGNALIDALFGANAAIMEAEGISCRWQLEPVPFPLTIDDVSLSALVTNALNNAIEACNRLDAHAEKWIAVTIRAKRTSLTMTVENACQNAEETVAHSQKRSSKRPSGAGYGLGIITDIAHAYSGEIDFSAKQCDAVMLIVYLPNVMVVDGAS